MMLPDRNDILSRVSHLHPSHSFPDAASQEMIFLKLPVGLLQCNCSIIGDRKTLEAIVVDPGDEVERILSLVGRY